MLITYNMTVCKTRHMHVCASALMHCPPLALPHRPTARYSHKRRRHLHICAFHFFHFFADHCWHCAAVCRRFRKSYQPSSFTLSALRSSIYYIQCTNGTCALQIPALKAIRDLACPQMPPHYLPGLPCPQIKLSMITCPYCAGRRPLPAHK